MTEQEIYSKLEDVFHEVLEDDDIRLEASTVADDIEDWDSLAQIELVAGIEAEFNIKLSMCEIEGLANVGAMVDVIATKVA